MADKIDASTLTREQLEEAFRLVVKADEIVPYVTATLQSPVLYDAQDASDTVPVHRGRATSSLRQLDGLENDVRSFLRGLGA